MASAWMVRAGEGGYLAQEFSEHRVVGIGWKEVGDLTSITTKEGVRAAYVAARPNTKLGEIGNAVAMVYKFRSILLPSDHVVTYDVSKREYLSGKIVSDYIYKPA